MSSELRRPLRKVAEPAADDPDDPDAIADALLASFRALKVASQCLHLCYKLRIAS